MTTQHRPLAERLCELGIATIYEFHHGLVSQRVPIQPGPGATDAAMATYWKAIADERGKVIDCIRQAAADLDLEHADGSDPGLVCDWDEQDRTWVAAMVSHDVGDCAYCAAADEFAPSKAEKAADRLAERVADDVNANAREEWEDRYRD